MPEDRMLCFDGMYSELFIGYIRYKRAIGYAIPVSYQYVLRDIARFLATRPPVSEVVPKHYAEEYMLRRDGESIANQCKRITILRQFCKYSASRGYCCHILPEGLVRPPRDFVPYIISIEEMTRIIGVADSMGNDDIALLIRLLWCCGLRIGEAIGLDVGDIDMENATLLIRKAKSDRARLLPLSRSLTSYLALVRPNLLLRDRRGDQILLPTSTGIRRNRSNTGIEIKKVMLEAEVTVDGKKPPRPHDIRHSYAVHALEKMDEEGIDLYASLPLLAVYMGHADIQSTEYYLRFTSQTRQRITDSLIQTSHAIFGGESDG